ncbi:universal stress protein [Virgibacillus sp. W0181]|uniref:universal stress protein n=1 Tax=Virgibacillus sp. W0181 TaxID=3391581 RepID=UPI003F44B8E8
MIYKKILIAYDGSALSDKAIQEVKNMTSSFPNIEVHIISIVEHTGPATNKILMDNITKELAENTEQKLNEIKKEFPDADVITKVIAPDTNQSPGKIICEYASDHDVSMIIVGSRGLGNISGTFLGSVSNRVIKEADRPVLVMKESAL